MSRKPGPGRIFGIHLLEPTVGQGGTTFKSLGPGSGEDIKGQGVGPWHWRPALPFGEPGCALSHILLRNQKGRGPPQDPRLSRSKRARRNRRCPQLPHQSRWVAKT